MKPIKKIISLLVVTSLFAPAVFAEEVQENSSDEASSITEAVSEQIDQAVEQASKAVESFAQEAGSQWEDFKNTYTIEYIRQILIEQTPITEDVLNKISDDQIWSSLKARFDQGQLGDVGNLYHDLKHQFAEAFSDTANQEEAQPASSESRERKSTRTTQKSDQEENPREPIPVDLKKLKKEPLELDFEHASFNIKRIYLVEAGAKGNEKGTEPILAIDYEYKNIRQNQEKGHPVEDWLTYIQVFQDYQEEIIEELELVEDEDDDETLSTDVLQKETESDNYPDEEKIEPQKKTQQTIYYRLDDRKTDITLQISDKTANKANEQQYLVSFTDLKKQLAQDKATESSSAE